MLHEKSNNAHPNRYSRDVVYYGSLLLVGTLAACGTGGQGDETAAPTHTTIPSTYTEVVQQPQVTAFGKYENASGTQVSLRVGDTVVARCVIYDPNGSGKNVSSTVGLWYELPKGSKAGTTTLQETMYLPSNAENNGPNGNNDNAYDPQVPVCADSPDQTLPSPTNPHNLTPAPTR